MNEITDLSLNREKVPLIVMSEDTLRTAARAIKVPFERYRMFVRYELLDDSLTDDEKSEVMRWCNEGRVSVPQFLMMRLSVEEIFDTVKVCSSIASNAKFLQRFRTAFAIQRIKPGHQ